MKFVKSSLLVKLVILILVVYATVTLVRLRSQINEKDAEVKGLTSSIASTQQENDRLQSSIDALDTPEGLEQVARCQRPPESKVRVRAAASSPAARSPHGSSRLRRASRRRSRSTICSSSSCRSPTAKCPPSAPIPTTKQKPEEDNVIRPSAVCRAGAAFYEASKYEACHQHRRLTRHRGRSRARVFRAQ